MNCDSCRALMCTEASLSRLRCARCRQIKLDQFRHFALQALLMALGGLFAWFLFRHYER